MQLFSSGPDRAAGRCANTAAAAAGACAAMPAVSAAAGAGPPLFNSSTDRHHPAAAAANESSRVGVVTYEINPPALSIGFPPVFGFEP